MMRSIFEISKQVDLKGIRAGNENCVGSGGGHYGHMKSCLISSSLQYKPDELWKNISEKRKPCITQVHSNPILFGA